MQTAEYLYWKLEGRPHPAKLLELQKLLKRARIRVDGPLEALLEADGRFYRGAPEGWAVYPLEGLFADKPLELVDWLVVDVETTGGHPEDDALLEVGAVLFREGLELSRLEMLVNPERAIPYFITRITGIDQEMVREAPPATEALTRLAQMAHGTVVLAHNAPFDMGFLHAQSRRLQLPLLTNPVLCTLKLARKLWPHIPRKGLDGLMDHFDIQADQRHRALADCLVTAQVFQRQLDDLRLMGVESLHDLIRFHHGSGRVAANKPNQAAL